jgi:hypothetical protein
VAAAAWAERERALLVEGRLQVAAYLMQVCVVQRYTGAGTFR